MKHMDHIPQYRKTSISFSQVFRVYTLCAQNVHFKINVFKMIYLQIFMLNKKQCAILRNHSNRYQNLLFIMTLCTVVYRIRISKFRLGISWLPGSLLTVRRTFLRRRRRRWCRCPSLIFQFLINAFLRTNDLGLQVERAALRSVISLHEVLVISLDQFRLIGTFRVQDTKGLFQGETGPGVGSDVLRSLLATARPPRRLLTRRDFLAQCARERFTDDLRPHHDDLYQVLRHGLTSPRTFGTSDVRTGRHAITALPPSRAWPVLAGHCSRIT